MAHQHVVHHPVAKVGRKHLAQFRASNKKTDRTTWLVITRDQCLLQVQQVQLLARLKAQGVGRVALVLAAGDVLLVKVLQREQGHGASSSGAYSHRVQLVVLVVGILVAIVGIEVPRVIGIGRVLRTGPVVVGLHTSPPTSPTQGKTMQCGATGCGPRCRVPQPESICLRCELQAGWTHDDETGHAGGVGRPAKAGTPQPFRPPC